MNDAKPTCEEISHWIWQEEELLDTEENSEIRRQIDAHCAQCSTCQRLRDEEFRLTAALIRGSAGAIPSGQGTRAGHPLVRPLGAHSRWGLGSAAVVLAASIALMAWLFPSGWSRDAASSRTTLAERKSRPSLGRIGRFPVVSQAMLAAPLQALQPSNFFDIPAGLRCQIEVRDMGTMHALGPAIFGLDRIGELWKVTMLMGHGALMVAPRQEVMFANQRGAEQLDEGQYFIAAEQRPREFPSRNTVTPADNVPDQHHWSQDHPALHSGQSPAPVALQSANPTASPEDLLARGLLRFQTSDWERLSTDPHADWQETAETLAQVVSHQQANAEQRSLAEFYRIAALSNAGRFGDVIQAGQQWLNDHPQERNPTILYVIGWAHWNQGDIDQAKAIWGEILAQERASPYRTIVENMLSQEEPGEVVQEPAAAQAPSTSEHAKSLPTTKGGPVSQSPQASPDRYLVVTVGLDAANIAHDGFRAAAQRAADFHRAEQFAFDGADFESLRAKLWNSCPRYVLFVIPPELLDLNFQRRIFLISPTLDDDLLADFSWGYLTARDGAAVLKLWNRIRKLHRRGLPHRTWLETAVVGGGMKSLRFDHLTAPHPVAAGFTGTTLYLGMHTVDPDVLEFAKANLPLWEAASVISITGNGDPQGIWLFDDRRNFDTTKHWPFDPARVGHDPKHELLRLTAARFQVLKLNSPILWSGTCHSGACRRVFVEPDIVSTFGRSERIELYELDPRESLALAWIDAGAAALLVPLGSNHGMAVLREQQFALEHGASLGETLKATYDDVFIQARGLPKLKMIQPGQPFDHSEPIMQAGGSHRILIGDPALRVFTSTPVPGERISIESPPGPQGAWSVLVEWDQGFHAHSWNMYGTNERSRYRVPIRIELPDDVAVARGANAYQASARMQTASGQEIPCSTVAVVEQHAGKTLLHLHAETQEDPTAEEAIRVRFSFSLPPNP